MAVIEITVGDELFSFPTFDNWCDTAQHKFGNAGVTSKDVLAVDARGRLCQKGAEFIRAKDDGTFPVRVYRLLCH